MDGADRWQRLEALFEQGVALPPAARMAWLQELGLEPRLHAELCAMLQADAADSGGGARLTRRFGAAVAALADAPLAGQQLGPYRLLGELGSGGSGVVFLAERADAQFRQQVAVKVIRTMGGDEAARQLRHERQLLAEFDHPGIARLFDGGETDQGQPWLAMEYVRGAPLTEACRARGIGLRERLALLAEVAHAVHYAHQRLVIHRDIKPANVLLREDGRPLLLDFGIAKLLDPQQRKGDHTQPWFTPAYASPEQRRGGTVSTATDVHALGLLLYELLTDRAPAVDAEGVLAAPSRALGGRRRRRVRGDLDRIVLRATALEPARRYRSAEALAEDIERYLDGRPVRAVPDSMAYRARRFLRRHPLGASAAALAVVVLLLLSWRLAWERDRALQAEAAALRESQAAEAVSAFLVGLFGAADPHSAGGAQLSPAQLVDHGVQQLRQQSLSGRERARLLATLGMLYTNLGQPLQASATLQQAIEAAEGAGIGARELSDHYAALSSALDRRGDYGAAMLAATRALELARSDGDPEWIATVQGDLALMVSRQGHAAQAEPLLREALQARRAVFGADSVPAAQAEAYLAEFLRLEQRLQEAVPLMDSAVARLRALRPAGHPDLLAVLSQQAELLRELGESGRAEAVLREILEHRVAMLETDSQLLGNVHSALGSLYYGQGRTREATAEFVHTLQIGERTLAADDPSLAIDYNNVASLYEEQGDYAAAEPLLRRALQIVEQHPDGHTPRIAQFRQNMGRLLMLAGQAEESRRLLELPVVGEGADQAMQQGRQRLHLAEWHRRYGSARQAHDWLAQLERHVDGIGGRAVPRYAQALRTRALLALAAQPPAHDAARAALAQARALLVEARGAGYVGVGELDLDLAQLELDAGNTDAARQALAAARPVLTAVVAPYSSQAQALAVLQRRLDP